MWSRRQFLQVGVAAATSSAVSVVAQVERRPLIVDAQVHVWKAESPDWRWVPGAQPQLAEPFTIEHLLPLMDEAGIDRAVLVPPGWTGDRNDYALEAAWQFPDRFAVMGRIPIRDPRSAALLPTWKNQPGMLGIRLTFLGQAASWLTDGSVDWFWPAAERAGIPVMILTPGRTSDLAAVAERHESLPLIVDHMGLVPQVVRDGKLADTVNQTIALAKYPNVSVKLSALVANSVEAYPFRDVTLPVRRVFDAFGPWRCYWGTDLTIDFSKATYRQRLAHVVEEMPFLSAEDKVWLTGRSILERLSWN